MKYDANPTEVASVSSLPASERYEYLINKTADWEEVWSVANESGWALVADDRGKEACPIWPAEAFAKTYCVNEWVDHAPKPIALTLWLDKWLPGLAADQRNVAVFPLPNDTGVIVEPSRLESDLRKALSQYE